MELFTGGRNCQLLLVVKVPALSLVGPPNGCQYRTSLTAATLLQQLNPDRNTLFNETFEIIDGSNCTSLSGVRGRY